MKAEIIGGLVTIAILACGYLFNMIGDCAKDSAEFPDQHEGEAEEAMKRLIIDQYGFRVEGDSWSQPFCQTIEACLEYLDYPKRIFIWPLRFNQ